jgi:hypothetical protein
MTAMRAARRTALALSLLAILAVAALVSVLVWPQPLHAHATSHGRLFLHSDRPYEVAAGQALLRDIERRLAAAPSQLHDPDANWHVVVSNSQWRRRLTFLDKFGAGGVNYHFLPNTAFLRQADIGRNRLIGGDGGDVPLPRSLAYFAAHEITHGMVTRHIGALARWRLPVWIDEGLADYIAFAGEVDIAELARAMRAGHRDLDPAASGLYGRYHLLVAHLLQVENWSLDDLLARLIHDGVCEQLADVA